MPERPALASGWGEGYLPNAIVTDQDGRALRFYDDVIRDKIVVVSFIYTGCSSICPLMTARLAGHSKRQRADNLEHEFSPSPTIRESKRPPRCNHH